jgi:glycosyltransferase involved in cell wall biosynthesis
MRGAERSFAAVADCWPDASIYTLLYDELGTGGRFSGRSVTPSYLQALHLRQHNFRRALPLFPRAMERLPVLEHDVIVSSSSAFAHGIDPRSDALHVCYCYTPFRYAWHERELAVAEFPWLARWIAPHVLERIRAWDRAASRRVDHYIAISETTRRRIQDYYGRDSAVIHPPVDVDRFELRDAEDYALVVTELVAHKRVEVALEAARRAGHPIKVVGTGPDLERLQAKYGGTAEFLGRVDDSALARLYSGARVLLMANVEEFGIAGVEAQAAGRPVVAAAAGGALETVIPGQTGVHVPVDDIDAMAEALRHVDFDRFSRSAIRLNAARFSTDAFRSKLRAEVARVSSRPVVDVEQAA